MVVNNRIWVGITAVLIVAIVLLGWVLGVAPRLGEVTANQLQLQGVDSQNAAHAAELERLKTESKKLDQYKAELADLQMQLPPDNDFSTFLGEINQLEIASGVVLTNFSTAAAAPFQLMTTAPTTEAPAATEPTEGEEDAEAPAAADPSIPGADPTQTLSPTEFVVIEVNITVDGPQAQVFDFVERLQNATRRYLVTSLDLLTEDTVTYTGTITGYVYVLIDPTSANDIDDEDTDEVAEEPLPEPSPSGAPSSSPSPSGSPAP